MVSRSIHVKAIFRGKDNSLGYRKNTEYVLSIRHESGGNVKIEQHKDGGTGQCEYESMLLFLDNWDCIRKA